MAGRPIVPEVAKEELYWPKRQRDVDGDRGYLGAHPAQHLHAAATHVPLRQAVRILRRAGGNTELLEKSGE